MTILQRAVPTQEVMWLSLRLWRTDSWTVLYTLLRSMHVIRRPTVSPRYRQLSRLLLFLLLLLLTLLRELRQAAAIHVLRVDHPISRQL